MTRADVAERNERIRVMLADGQSHADIAKAVRMSIWSIRKVSQRYGLRVRMPKDLGADDTHFVLGVNVRKIQMRFRRRLEADRARAYLQPSARELGMFRGDAMLEDVDRIQDSWLP